MYIAMGDSITAGESASSPRRTYVNLVGQHLTRFGPNTNGPTDGPEVLARPGWTSEALARAVKSRFSSRFHQAKFVSIWVGGDDLAYAALAISRGAPRTLLVNSLRHYARDLEFIVGSVRRVSSARIVLCTQYNPFPNSLLAVQGIQALNDLTVRSAIRLHTGLAPAHLWFEGRQQQLIYGYQSGRIQDVLHRARSPVHPNDHGHQVIANGLLPLLTM